MPNSHEQTGDLVKERAKTKKQEPKQFKVVLLNDDYTTMEFVVSVLETVFQKSPAEAFKIMMSVHMNGRGIFNFMIQRLPGTLKACLEKNGLNDERIDYYVLHQASRFMLQTLGTRLRIPAEKMPMNLERVGNTVSSSIPLLLAELDEKRALRGKTVLISGFGVGLSWASNILKFEA